MWGESNHFVGYISLGQMMKRGEDFGTELVCSEDFRLEKL